MGKSAKVQKRTKKKTSNAGTGTSTALSTPTAAPTPKPAAVQAAAAASVASAVKKAKLKKGNKTKRAKLRSSSSIGGHVLGGADYVDIMMGSRRREREEALKLPRDTDTDVVASESPPRR